MKVYKVTLMVVDFDGVGDAIKDEIENVRYGNDCINPEVMKMESVDIGEWSDNHPLNHVSTYRQEFFNLFELK